MEGGKVLVHVTMSLDGYIAGPNDDLDWVFEYTETSCAAEMAIQTAGPPPGPTPGAAENGHADASGAAIWPGPQFLLIHDPPLAGSSTVAVVDGDIRGAVASALAAARGSSLIVTGASIVRHCLEEGLVDELLVHLVPVLLGDGVRLFGVLEQGPIELEPVGVARSGQLADLRFRVAS